MGNTLRELQLCELSILKKIQQICEKYHLVFYLSSGTLLGAVRHQGFIPWDDDIDIEMPYEDLLRFNQVAPAELGDGYFVENNLSASDFSHLYTKVRKNGTTALSKYERGLPGHHGVWVDIFPIIDLGGKADYILKKSCVRVCNFLVMDDRKFQITKDWLREQGGALLFAAVSIARHLPIRTRRRIQQWLSKIVFRKKKNPPRKAHVWNSITYVHPAKVFDGAPKLLPFEDAQFPCPPMYEEYLTNAYGDYMKLPPEEKRNGNHGDVIIDLAHSWEQYNHLPEKDEKEAAI